MKRVLSCIAVLGTALLLSTGYARAEDKVLAAFKLKNAEGKEVTQEAFKGKKTLFVVVQTACSQCRTELDDISKNLDKVKAKAEVVVILVDANSEIGLKRYQEMGYAMPLLLDPMFNVPASVDINVTPGTFATDKDLKVYLTKTGYRPGTLDQLIDKL